MLAQSPSPEAAKIAIATARKNKQLRLRCTLRELKAQPGLRLTPGERPPPAPTIITPDYATPSDTRFNHFDWERSFATSRDSVTRSLFEYVEIVVNRDEVLALWPAPLVQAPEAATGARASTSTPSGKPDGVSARVWAVARLLEQLDQGRGAPDIGLGPNVLLADVRKIALQGMTVSETTLREARRFRKDPAKYCQQLKAKKRKTRRRRS